jgi:hypothetical protein
MDIGLQKLKELYFLEPKKVDEIAERIIRNDTLGITTAKSPHVVILGGQCNYFTTVIFLLVFDLIHEVKKVYLSIS